MSKVKALYHIVFCTKRREMTLPLNLLEDLYRFIWRKITDRKCKLIRIGGIQNHVHILIDLHPSVALSELMQTIKGVSSSWMQSDPRFSSFRGWASDYYAGTISLEMQPAVIEYIKNQQTHHLGEPFDNEIMKLYQYSGIKYDERDLQ